MPAGELQYSSHWSNTRAGSVRTLAAMYGCALTSRQNRTNSVVPKAFGSYLAGPAFTSLNPGSPAQKLVRVGRWSRGPTPSRQSYESAKHPPGQRITLGLMSFRASTSAFRTPPILGTFEFSPTHTPS